MGSSDWVIKFNLQPHQIVHRLSVLNGYALDYLPGWDEMMVCYAAEKRNKKYRKKKQIGDGLPFSEDKLETCRLKMSAQLKLETRVFGCVLNDDVLEYILGFIGDRNDAISFCIAFRDHARLESCLLRNPDDYEVISFSS